MIYKTSSVEYYLDVDPDIKNDTIPVVLLHGFTGSNQVWKPFCQHLPCPCISIDIPGHGQSRFIENIESYSIDEFCDDLHEILQKLNIQSINLVGYSMGGRLALIFANRYPECVQSLILESATPGYENVDDRKKRLMDDMALAEKIRTDFQGFLSYWDKKFLFRNHKQRNPQEYEILTDIRKNCETWQLSKALEYFSPGNQDNLWPHLAEFSFPIMIIAGEEDNKFSQIANRMWKCLRHSSVHVIPSCGHTVHLEEPVTFRNILTDWLKLNC